MKGKDLEGLYLESKDLGDTDGAYGSRTGIDRDLRIQVGYSYRVRY